MTGITAAKYDVIFEKAGITSPKQRAFVLEYFNNDFNGAEAVRKAGYKTPYPNRISYELLNKGKIKKAIHLLAEDRKEKVSITEDWLMTKLKKGIESAEADGNLTAYLRGLEIGMRSLGMFIEKTEITGKDGDAIKMERINEDVAEVTRSIARLAKRGREDEATIGDDG